jgi:hypothetical protein
MSAYASMADVPGQDVSKCVGPDPALVAQLRCIHMALRVKLATVTQVPEGESYEATLLRLRREINVLATSFLELSEKLLAHDRAFDSTD